ncbi:hypothetical protein [Intestinibacter sp.]|uniref:hypothetical protein n=1 Tax=Intestinibacter sp. TaxID=1965304 RepID=UPI002A7476C2|nr:hypothetical protein [Intestinibacter sp.]MDY2734714.1 hypothetical protein [Intestinibacter sp.]
MKKLLSVILCILMCLGVFGCSKSDVQASRYTPLLGELVEAKETGDTLYIKVKIKENEDKELTIEQNEFNIDDLVTAQGADKFNSIEYVAVMDKDKKETEVLSFTVNKETIQNLKDRQINIGTVIARSEDVNIASNLKSYKNIEQIAEADTTESSDNKASETSNNTSETEKTSNSSSNNSNSNSNNINNSYKDDNSNNNNNNDSDNSSNNSGITVYVSRQGIYHKSPNAHGMKYYTEMTLDEAQSSGYDRCDSCY